jgi:hypothetical protein
MAGDVGGGFSRRAPSAPTFPAIDRCVPVVRDMATAPRPRTTRPGHHRSRQSPRRHRALHPSAHPRATDPVLQGRPPGPLRRRRHRPLVDAAPHRASPTESPAPAHLSSCTAQGRTQRPAHLADSTLAGQPRRVIYRPRFVRLNGLQSFGLGIFTIQQR